MQTFSEKIRKFVCFNQYTHIMRFKSLLLTGIMASLLTLPMYADKLVIMHTNDTHGKMIAEKASELGGVERRKVVIDSIRKAEKHSLLVDAGDDVQGFMYFAQFNGEVEYGAMNRLGYDITIPGNHEFDNGIDSLYKYYNTLSAIKLNANYDFSKTILKDTFKEYTIKEYNKKKIAFIGLGCQPKGLISDKNIAGVIYHDPIAVGDSIARVLKSTKKADYVVVLSHLGYEADYEYLPSDSLMALNSSYIDVIIGGHSHTDINASTGNHQYIFKNKAGKNVLVAQTGEHGEYLGIVKINLDNLSSTPTSELIPIDSRYDGRTDAEFGKWLAGYTDKVNEVSAKVIGTSLASYAKKEVNPLTNWVADLIYQIGDSISDKKVDFAIGNVGGVRRDLPKGDVTVGLMLTMVPFANYVCVIDLDGQSVIDAFNVVAQRGGECVSKHVYATMKDGKIEQLLINGKPVDPNKTYTIATINYIMEGGDNMPPMPKCTKLCNSDRYLKYDVIDIVKAMTAKGEPINPDTNPRMINIK